MTCFYHLEKQLSRFEDAFYKNTIFAMILYMNIQKCVASRKLVTHLCRQPLVL